MSDLDESLKTYENSPAGGTGESGGPLNGAQGGRLPELSGFRLIREISRGGQGAVFEGIQTSTGRRVAVKMLHSGALIGKTELARFEREVQILAALNHPNIVSIVDRGETKEGGYFLAMNYIAGQTLDVWVANYYRTHPNGPPLLDPSELLRVFLKICDAVNASHLRGIVHRDLKPANILIDDRGEPHILDFGLAHTGLSAEADGQPVTITGQFMGSLPWASPEQAEGGGGDRIDTRTDVYSLGVILYQLLTNGKFPYEVAGTMVQVLNNIMNAEPTPPSLILNRQDKKAKAARQKRSMKRTATLNPIIEAVVLKALSKARENRYQTAGELARDIANYLSGRPTLAAGEPPRAPMRHRAALIAALVVLLILSVFATWWVTSRPPAGLPLLSSSNQSDGALPSVTPDASGAPGAPSADNVKASTPAPAQGPSSASNATGSPLGKPRTPGSSTQTAGGGKDAQGGHRVNPADKTQTVPSNGVSVQLPEAVGIQTAAFASNGTRLLAFYKDETLRLWDVPAGRSIVVDAQASSYAIDNVAGHPCLTDFVGASFNRGVRWIQSQTDVSKTIDGALQPVFEGAYQATSVAISENGKVAVDGEYHGTVKVFDTAGKRKTLTIKSHGYSDKIRFVALTPDGTLCASICAGQVKFWDTASGNAKGVIAGPDGAAAFSPDNSQFAVVEGTNVSVYLVNDLSKTATLKSPSKPRSIAWSGDSTSVAMACEDGSLRFSRAQEAGSESVLWKHTGPIIVVDRIRENQFCALSEDGVVYTVTAAISNTNDNKKSDHP